MEAATRAQLKIHKKGFPELLQKMARKMGKNVFEARGNICSGINSNVSLL